MDKKNLPKDANKNLSREDRKKLFQESKQGTADHKQYKSLSKNLIPLNERSPEEQKAIRRKAAEATNRIKGEKKTAKQILDTLLPLYANNTAINNNEGIPEDVKAEILKHNIKITQYDLIMLAQIYQAQQGNTKAAEFIAAHNGDIVQKDLKITQGISDADKMLLQKLQTRLNIEGTAADQE